MDLLPPSHGPADRTVAPPPADLPDVAESVTGRARDLHRLADALSGGAVAGDGPAATSPAVALLRAHAGAVDDLAEHLLAAGSDASALPAEDAADSAEVAGASGGDTDAPGPRTAG
jgi:hypothetical protein